ncbi:unnamed protein product, partial [Didymodactylos carnosus]
MASSSDSSENPSDNSPEQSSTDTMTNPLIKQIQELRIKQLETFSGDGAQKVNEYIVDIQEVAKLT